jgi:hypothetical protein
MQAHLSTSSCVYSDKENIWVELALTSRQAGYFMYDSPPHGQRIPRAFERGLQ